jgi:hypothetical protein
MHENGIVDQRQCGRDATGSGRGALHRAEKTFDCVTWSILPDITAIKSKWHNFLELKINIVDHTGVYRALYLALNIGILDGLPVCSLIESALPLPAISAG